MNYLIFLLAFTSLFSCNNNSQPLLPPLSDPVYTSTIDFTGEKRIYYTVTGPTWDDPNIKPENTLFEMGRGQIDEINQIVIPDTSYLAAYCSEATPILTFYPVFKSKEIEFNSGTYELSGILFDQNSGDATDFFSSSGTLHLKGSENEFQSITIAAKPLPKLTGKLYTLEITHHYTVNGTEYSQITQTELAQTWKCPLPGTPLYEKIIRWGSSWINGYIPNEGQVNENEISDILLTSMVNLEPLGYRYGPFPRPSEIDDSAEVFLDFIQSACGEISGFFMALTETQGIDSNWLLFIFDNPSSTNFSMYQTINLPALGTKSMVWRYSNHKVVQVNGKIYDPTYLLIKKNTDEYEDYIFASFCYGKDEPCKTASDWCTIPNGPQGICIENPPGFTDGVSPNRFTGEDYY